MPEKNKQTDNFAELTGVEIFAAGQYPQGKYTRDDLIAIADSYDPKFHEAPCYVDHPDDQGKRSAKGASCGWIKKLYVKGDSLLADIRQIPDKFMECLKQGLIKKRSVEIYPDLQGKGPYLRALAWLGANVPQVKGLADVEFKDKDGEYESIDFSDMPSLEQVLADYETNEKLRRVINAFCDRAYSIVNGADNTSVKVKQLKSLADELSGLDILQEIDEMSETTTNNATQATQQQTTPPEQTPTGQPAKTFSESEVKSMIDMAVKAAKDEVKTEILSQINSQACESEIRNFCEQMVREGRMSPAERSTEEPLLINARKQELTQQFSEGQVPLTTQRMNYYRQRDPALFREIDKGKAGPDDKTRKAKDVVSKAVQEFSEHKEAQLAGHEGIYIVQSLRNAGYTDSEIANMSSDILSDENKKAAGITR